MKIFVNETGLIKQITDQDGNSLGYLFDIHGHELWCTGEQSSVLSVMQSDRELFSDVDRKFADIAAANEHVLMVKTDISTSILSVVPVDLVIKP